MLSHKRYSAPWRDSAIIHSKWNECLHKWCKKIKDLLLILKSRNFFRVEFCSLLFLLNLRLNPTCIIQNGFKKISDVIRHVHTCSVFSDLKRSCEHAWANWQYMNGPFVLPALSVRQLHRKSADLCGVSSAVMKGMFMCQSGKQTSDIDRHAVFQLHLLR